MKDEFKKDGYHVSSKDLPFSVAKGASFFSKDMHGLVKSWHKEGHISNEKARTKLGVEF